MQRGITSGLLSLQACCHGLCNAIPGSRSCPTQTLLFPLPISQRHHVEGEFPAAQSCQVAKPSCASGKVDLALCPLQDKSRLIALHDVNQGCVYLLGFTGLVPRGMCSPGQLSPAPRVEETERVWDFWALG